MVRGGQRQWGAAIMSSGRAARIGLPSIPASPVGLGRRGNPAAAGSTSGTPGGASPGIPSKPAEQITAGFDGDRWSAVSEVVAYGMAGEVTGGPAGAPESGTPA